MHDSTLDGEFTTISETFLKNNPNKHEFNKFYKKKFKKGNMYV